MARRWILLRMLNLATKQLSQTQNVRDILPLGICIYVILDRAFLIYNILHSFLYPSVFLFSCNFKYWLLHSSNFSVYELLKSLKIEAGFSSVSTDKITPCQNPEDHNLCLKILSYIYQGLEFCPFVCNPWELNLEFWLCVGLRVYFCSRFVRNQVLQLYESIQIVSFSRFSSAKPGECSNNFVTATSFKTFPIHH